MKSNLVILRLVVLWMVFGKIGVAIQAVLLHVALVHKHEHEPVEIKQMEDIHAWVRQRKPFHVIPPYLVQV